MPLHTRRISTRALLLSRQRSLRQPCRTSLERLTVAELAEEESKREGPTLRELEAYINQKVHVLESRMGDIDVEMERDRGFLAAAQAEEKAPVTVKGYFHAVMVVAFMTTMNSFVIPWLLFNAWCALHSENISEFEFIAPDLPSAGAIATVTWIVFLASDWIVWPFLKWFFSGWKLRLMIELAAFVTGGSLCGFVVKGAHLAYYWLVGRQHDNMFEMQFSKILIGTMLKLQLSDYWLAASTVTSEGFSLDLRNLLFGAIPYVLLRFAMQIARALYAYARHQILFVAYMSDRSAKTGESAFVVWWRERSRFERLVKLQNEMSRSNKKK